MDILSAIGIIAGFVVMAWGIMNGGEFITYVDVGSIIITIGGTITTIVSSFPLKTLKTFIPAFKVALFSKKYDPIETVDTIADLAEKARKNGLLSLEDAMAGCKDEFLKRGVLIIVDTHDKDAARKILETEIEYTEMRHAQTRSIFEKGGSFAPAFGMIGTLIGLVNMLKNLNESDTLGASMSVALITTFYGSLLANVLFIPVASKLKLLDEQETFCKEIVIEGVLGILVGENPRILKERLLSNIPPAEKAPKKKKKEK